MFRCHKYQWQSAAYHTLHNYLHMSEKMLTESALYDHQGPILTPWWRDAGKGRSLLIGQWLWPCIPFPLSLTSLFHLSHQLSPPFHQPLPFISSASSWALIANDARSKIQTLGFWYQKGLFVDVEHSITKMYFVLLILLCMAGEELFPTLCMCGAPP